jgi:hypothetical protein
MESGMWKRGQDVETYLREMEMGLEVEGPVVWRWVD